MPHRCVKCGKEYKEASFAVLKGCEQCGGKKFLYTRVNQDSSRPVHPPGHPGDNSRQSAPAQNNIRSEQNFPEKSEGTAAGNEGQRVESIRIISPGTYELNITKLAESDERVVATGGDGSYMVDLISMMKPKRKRNQEK